MKSRKHGGYFVGKKYTYLIIKIKTSIYTNINSIIFKSHVNEDMCHLFHGPRLISESPQYTKKARKT